MDINEIMNRAKAAQAQALASLHEMEEKAEALAASSSPAPAVPPQNAAQEAQQMAADTQRQVEILGQVFDSQTMEQMAANQEQLQRMMEQRVAEAACASADAMMDQLFGEDMGVLAAALETLAMEEEGEGPGLDDEEETDGALYALLDETLARLDALPEPAPVEYGSDPALWGRFGILLSGIVSTLNDHSLDGLDVEEHIPVLEQQVLSVVRRSWGIDGRGGLLETLRYLGQGGYAERYRFYCEAETPEELMTGDEDDREGVIRAWAFARHYRERYSPAFMAGWDVGRAAMLARWGSYLGWITPEEAQGILWDLAQRAARDLGGWREFAQSYLFGGLMWKLLCNSPAAGYLGYLADAATTLLVGKADGSGGQWRGFAWPARRRLGFTL